MLTLAKPQQVATGLWLIKTDYKMSPYAFPDNGAYQYVYSSATNVRLMARVEGTGSAALDYVLQIANESTTLNLTAPYVGWDKPAGLVWQETHKRLPTRTVPEDPTQSTYDTVNMDGFGSPVVKLGPSAKYVYLNRALPFFTMLTKKGTIFYVRVVPVLANKTQLTVAAPPSNWLPFYITVSRTEQEDKEQVAIAARLAAAAKAKEEEKLKALIEERKNMREALARSYEIRVLSYIPPKFSDDKDAPEYFLANRKVTITYDGGDAVTQLGPGNTYYLVQIKNMLNSNKTWSQELWDLASATLNQASQGYQSAKNAAVDTMASGINTVGIECDDKCKGALMTGLNVALSTCGVPPTIPNIDQLYNKGLDYLTETVADMALEQMTGVPIGDLGVDAGTTRALAKQARGPIKDGLSKMLYSITHPTAFDPGVPETWGVPSPFFRRRPAMLYLEIRLKPGAKPPTNQAWQRLDITFDSEFATIPNISLPRTVEARVRIPIALAPLRDPKSWSVAGVMPDFNVNPDAGVGQPYYGDRGTVNIGLVTQHRMASGSFGGMIWPSIQISPGYVDAIPLPDERSLLPNQIDTALKNGTRKLAPPNYYGKISLRWFTK